MQKKNCRWIEISLGASLIIREKKLYLHYVSIGNYGTTVYCNCNI